MHGAMLKLKWVLLYMVSRAGLLLPRRLVPTRLAYAVAVRGGDACYLAFRGPRRKIIANLTRVLGDEAAARKAAREAFRQYARYIIDLFQLPALGPTAVRARTDFDRWPELDAVIAQGKGTIFVTMHFGHQEMGAAVMSAMGYNPHVVARTLELGPMDELIQGFREEMGMKVIAAEKGPLQVFRCLHRGDILGMLIDMVDGDEGVIVDFFGAPAEMSSAAARIALRTGASVVPTVIARSPVDDRRFIPLVDTSLRVEPTGDEEADALALTQRIAQVFEGYVREYPDQWFAFRNVWRTGTGNPEQGTRQSGRDESGVQTAEQEAGSGKREPGAAAAKTKDEVTWNDRLNHWALEAANFVFGRLPVRWSYAIANRVGDLAYRLRKPMAAGVEDNMRHALPPGAPESQVKACAREVFRNVTRYYVDLIRMPRTSPEQLLANEIRVTGIERLREAMGTTRGAVISTAHFGCPEIGTQISALMGLDVIVLSEPLNPPAFSDLVHRLREAQGVRYEEVGFKTIGRVIKHLRTGGSLGITCDRDIQSTGAWLPFFGEETRLPLGAAELALRTGAVFCPAYCRRRPGGYDMVFEEPIEVVDTGRAKLDAIETAKKMVARMEEWIASDPGQWMVLERIWDQPTGVVHFQNGQG